MWIVYILYEWFFYYFTSVSLCYYNDNSNAYNKIKRLLESLSNTNNSQKNHIIQQLNELKNEIEKYNIDTKDYFEFKKWNDDTWKMLKLDKNNDMVTKQYQEIMQKING